MPQAGDSEMNNHEFGPHNLVEGKRDIKVNIENCHKCGKISKEMLEDRAVQST